MTTALIITMNRVEKVTTSAGVRAGTLRERMSRSAAPSAVKKPKMAKGEAASPPGWATMRAPVMPRPTSARRRPPAFSPKNSHMPSSTTSGAIWAMAVTSAMGMWPSAMMKQRMATTSLKERSTTQGLKAFGSSRMRPMAKTTGRHHRQAAMPRMTSTWKGGASASASFMQVSLATKAPVARMMAPMPRRFWEIAIESGRERLPAHP